MVSETPAVLELQSFRISHFSEKIRWCLDAAGFDYRERRRTPVLHVVTTLTLGLRRTTLPVLCTPEGAIQDSTRILRWLERQPQFAALLPDTGPQRAEAFALEDRLDHMGDAVLICCYAAILDHPTAILEWWTPDADSLDRRILKLLLPLVRPLMRWMFKMDPAGLAAAARTIDETLDALDARLADGGSRYLIGDRFSFADITACALLGPLFGPAQHPMWSAPAVRARVETLTRQWRGRPTAAWVLERYEQDRGSWRNALPASLG